MGALRFREGLRHLYLATIRRVFRSREEITPGASAIVFAPHQDDETLGCGGTIFKKRRSNVAVGIVYMTNGGASSNLMPPAALSSIRAREATESAAVLGVEADHLKFLDFPDRQLASHAATAEDAVLEILKREKPHEVFIPCWRDQHADHVATNAIVLAALKRLDTALPVVYEYPVWFWSHWPLVDHAGGTTLRRKLASFRGGLLHFFWLLSRFNCRTFVGDALERKRTSLAKHVSQMTPLVDDPRWPTLPDVARGEWLPLLFQDYEIFCRRPAPKGPSTKSGA